VHAISSTDVWAAGDADSNGKGALHYDGANWSLVSTGFASLRDLWASTSTDVWAGTLGSLAYHWDGSFWSPVSVGSSDTRALWGFAQNDIFSAVDIAHWNGAQWSQVINPAETVVKLWGATPDDIWGVGPANTIYHWGGSIPQAPAGACVAPTTLYCGANLTGSNTGANRLGSAYACAGARADTGGESTYRFDSPINGVVTFTLTPRGADLDLVVLGEKPDGTCNPSVCMAASQTSGTGAEQIMQFPVAKGDDLHVIVDGFAGATAGYSLQVQCTKQ
jgi:hypothetical protein